MFLPKAAHDVIIETGRREVSLSSLTLMEALQSCLSSPVPIQNKKRERNVTYCNCMSTLKSEKLKNDVLLFS